MAIIWTERMRSLSPAGKSIFAPDWYIEAKKSGATKAQLFEIVREYCQEVFAKEAKETGEEMEEVDDFLVKLIISSYEA